jgi:beta-galactosidase
LSSAREQIGEFLYSRYPAAEWEDELIKIKLGGVSIVATYVFWIHHAEEEGCFRRDGDRDLRRFIELCGRHELLAIVRVGPFAHGEVRNCGFPDWLYGRPVRLRSNNTSPRLST